MAVPGVGVWSLTLYVSGASKHSMAAVEAVRELCDRELRGRVELEVVDVREQPALAVRDRVIATPTLLKRRPGAPRRIVGDLSDRARLRRGLDLDPVADPAPRAGTER